MFLVSLNDAYKMDVVMYSNYIKWMEIYEWMYNLCDYLTYQCIFFSNNEGEKKENT